MATGDQDDIVARLQRWLPQGWFPTNVGTRIFAVLSGFASVLATAYAKIANTKLQTRVVTATEGFLELISFDFFDTALPRLAGEPDENYSLRIRHEVFRDKLTRHAIDDLLYEMTGKHPTIYELQRPYDTGAWGYNWGWGYGHYASRSDTLAVFIITDHAGQFGIPNIGGWGTYLAGWGQQQFVYAGPDMIVGTGFSDAQIYAALDRIRAAGITYWVQIGDPNAPTLIDTETGDLLVTETGLNITA